MGAAGTTDMLIAASEAVSSVLRIPTVDAWLPGTLDGVDHMTAVSSASDDRVRPPPGADLAARSWRSGRPAWGDDILRANGDDGRAPLMPGLALPIPGSGGTLGVLTLPGVGSHRATEVRSIAASALRALGQAVQRLQAEERYRRATDSLPDLLMVHGAERILHVNATAVRMLRAESAEEIVDKPLLSVFDPGEWETALAQASAVLGGGPAVAASIVRSRLKRVDGTTFDVEAVVAPMTWHGRPAVHIVGRDAAGQFAAERALRASEHRYRSIVDSAEEGILMLDRAGTAEFGNPRLATLLGRRPDQLPGRRFIDFVHADDADEVRRHLERVQLGERVQFECRLETSRDEPLWSLVSISPLWRWTAASPARWR